jgi:hypothetical protein
MRQALERVVWAETQTERCELLWREVIWRIVLDLEPGWNISKRSVAEARDWFESNDAESRANRATLCALAGIGEGVLLNAYRDGRLRMAALNPLGRRRWETRMRNKALREAARLAGIDLPERRRVTPKPVSTPERERARAMRQRRSEWAARARNQSREALAMVR